MADEQAQNLRSAGLLEPSDRALASALSDSSPLARIVALNHLLVQIPKTQAVYLALDTTDPNYNIFVAGPLPVEDGTSREQKVQADVNNFLASSTSFAAWMERARQIRISGDRAFCVGNLSVALDVGAAYAAGMTGANTLLSLVPTAGVLIGPSAKELWVL